MMVIKRASAVLSALAVLLSSNITGLTAIAEGNDTVTDMENEFLESEYNFIDVNVPEDWTNTTDNWVSAENNVTVSYKILETIDDEGLLNDYFGATEWHNRDIPEGEGYIQFFAVKDVNGKKLYSTEEPVPYKYDNTDPEKPVLKIIKENGRHYIQNKEPIDDGLSGIKEIKCDDACESIDYEETDTGIYFKIPITDGKANQNIKVEIYDNAGNYADPYIHVNNFKWSDISGFEGNTWVNNLNSWNVRCNDDTNIYYKTSSDQNIDWGSYTDEDARLWTNVEDAKDIIPQGDMYIHFWTVSKDETSLIHAETKSYKYDNTAPNEFKVKLEERYYRPFYKELIYSSEGIITDDLSGIRNIRVQIGGQSRHIGLNNENKFSFTINAQEAEGKNVEFYAVDNAGNEIKSSSVVENFYAPEINNMDVYSKDSDGTFKQIEAQEYGTDKNNTNTNYIYANSSDYLKINMKEANVDAFIVSVNDSDNFEYEITEEFMKSNVFENMSYATGSGNKDVTDCDYYIPLNDLNLTNNKANTITIQAKSEHDKVSNAMEISLVYDADESTVKYDSSCTDSDGNDVETLNNLRYYGQAMTGEITVDIQDATGIKNYLINVIDKDNKTIKKLEADFSAGIETKGTYTKVATVTDENGVVTDENKNTVTTVVTDIVTYKMPNKNATETIPVIADSFPADGEYIVQALVEDIAGNKYDKPKQFSFFIDRTAPTIENNTYTISEDENSPILNFKPFGIFTNKDFTIAFKVKEEISGITANNIILYFNDEDETGFAATKKGNEYTITVKADKIINRKGIPRIELTDKIGNTSVYYFTTGKGILTTDEKLSTSLMVENIKPTASVVLPPDYIEINGVKWYSDDINYNVYAADVDSEKCPDMISGLSNATITENHQPTPDTPYVTTDIYKSISDSTLPAEQKYVASTTYTQAITQEGNYTIVAEAVDNAGNIHISETENFSVDKTDPEILGFLLLSGDEREDITPISIKSDIYGYYFQSETIVKVKVRDIGNSSGLNYTALICGKVSADNQREYSLLKATSYEINEKTKDAYAVFTIKESFKGHLWAITTDNVSLCDIDKINIEEVLKLDIAENKNALINYSAQFKHTSGFSHFDGTILETPEMHAQHSDVEITVNTEINGKDADGNPLHNDDIPLTVHVKDTFSGIGKIHCSIANDEGKDGEIIINNDKTIVNNGEHFITIDPNSIVTDKNLITELSFDITVSSNTNANKVSILLVDRAENYNTKEKVYSIDKTTPTITASIVDDKPQNSIYYKDDQTVKVSITERNFNGEDVVFTVNGESKSLGGWKSEGEGDNTVHTAEYTITGDGDYSYTVAYTDMAGNKGEIFSQPMFVIDKTPPVLKTNFSTFGKTDKENFFGCSSMGKTAEITITEHNFSAEAANVTLYKKSPGSDHNTNGMSKIPASDWTHEGDVHTLKIPFEKNDDGVYYIKVSPHDLASNPTESQETAVFEIDFTNPVITSRNGNNAENKYENLEIYSEKTGIEEGFIPSVEFDDKNFDHLEYEITVYTPEYTNARELGEIVPDTDEGKTEEKVYSLPEFTKDGVYSADVVAVDKAGNKSTLCRNTSVLMMNTDVLAYISNSSKSAQTGWYSLQKDENTPISKRPDSFSNLEITVFAREDSDTRIILRNANGESKDTGITAENSDDMYGMAVYNYVLPKEYFVDNYPDGTNEDIYLWAENTADGETSHTSLGWIRLDSLAPDCDVPDNLKSWKSFTGSTKTFTLSGISESLDKSKCMVYDNGNAVPAEKIQYSDENHSLSYTLEKGWHDLSFVLVDEAGNIFTVQEVSSVQVGLLYCLWFRILLGVIGAAGIAALVIFLVKKKSKRYL